MPWYQAGIRGRTKVRNAELFQMAQQAKEEQDRLQAELDEESARRAQIRRDLAQADAEARRPGLRTDQYRQARDRAEGLRSQLQTVSTRLADLANRLRVVKDGNVSSLQLRRKELGCSSLDSVNCYGHPGTSVPFDIKAMPMFEGKSGDDPEEWEQRVRDLCHEYNLYGRKLIDYMNQRIGPKVKHSMQGFNRKPENERSDPSQWLQFFRQIYSSATMCAHHMQQFDTMKQQDEASHHDFLNSLKYAYGKAWPDAAALEHDPAGVRRILNRFYQGMAPGPNGAIKQAVHLRFFMDIDDHLKKPPEEAFAALLKTAQAAWNLAYTPDIGGSGMTATAKPTEITGATGSPAVRCLHCKGDHPTRRCPQAAVDRRETIKMLIESEAMDELPIDEREDVNEDVLMSLMEVKEVDGQEPLCFECNQPGHFRRDCPTFLRRMRVMATRFKTRFQNRPYPRGPQRVGVSMDPMPRFIATHNQEVRNQMHEQDAFDELLENKIRQSMQRAFQERDQQIQERRQRQERQQTSAPAQPINGQPTAAAAAAKSKNS
jgi:hypothetical protein